MDNRHFVFTAFQSIVLILIGIFIGMFILRLIEPPKANAEIVWTPNPLFDPIPVDKAGAPLVSYTQEQKDMTMLYGRLDYIVKQLNDLQNTCAKH